MENPILSMASQCLESADGNWEKAARLLRRRVNRDPKAKESLFERAFDQLCWLEIRMAARQNRQLCLTGREGKDSPVGLEQMAETQRLDLLDYSLRGGVRLADAHRPELEFEADFSGKLARSNGIKARWLRMIHDGLPDDQKTVSDLFSNTQLSEMRTRAEAATV